MTIQGFDGWGDLPDEPPQSGEGPKGKKPKGKPGDCIITERPNLLKEKVGPGVGMDMAAVARAEKVIEQHKAGYEARVEQELERLEALFTEMHLTGRFDLKAIQDMVHEIRGEAGTFDYPLLTRIGKTLCEILAVKGKPTQDRIQAIGTHIKAMRTVVLRQVRDDGGTVGKGIVSGLEKLVANLKI